MSTIRTAPPAIPDTLLMTAGDLARQLRTSTRTIRRWDQSGQLGPRPLKIGGTVRWRRCDVMAWLSAGCLCRRDWELANKK
jgi:excisionase family DNA binding protein